MKLLLAAGADVNRKTLDGGETSLFDGVARLWGETPLHFAAAYASADMVRILLEAGADKNIPNAHGDLPRSYYSRHRETPFWPSRQPRAIGELLQ